MYCIEKEIKGITILQNNEFNSHTTFDFFGGIDRSLSRLEYQIVSMSNCRACRKLSIPNGKWWWVIPDINELFVFSHTKSVAVPDAMKFPNQMIKRQSSTPVEFYGIHALSV